MVPAITLFGLTDQGEAPYWHQIADTYDKIDRSILQRTYELIDSLIRQIDSCQNT